MKNDPQYWTIRETENSSTYASLFLQILFKEKHNATQYIAMININGRS